MVICCIIASTARKQKGLFHLEHLNCALKRPPVTSHNTNPRLPRFCLELPMIVAAPFAALAVRLWRYALRVQCQRHDPTRRWSHQNYHHWINGGGAHGVAALGKDRNSCAVANSGSRNERIRTTGNQ